MIRQMIGAAIGSKIAKKTPVLGGASGVVLSTAVPFVLSRFSLPAMAVIGAGGYFAKRYLDRKQAEDAASEPARTGAMKTAKAPKSDTGTVIDPPPGGAAKQPRRDLETV